jgi:RNA-splicing ligase RtcB
LISFQKEEQGMSPVQQMRPLYYCTDHYRDALISEPVKSVVNAIANILSQDDFIGVYPDAMYENWGIPTGLLFASTPERAFLFPSFLRDPGCGYLVFRVKLSQQTDLNWYHTAGELLDTFVRHPNNELRKNVCASIAAAGIEGIVSQGLDAVKVKQVLHDREYFQNTCFSVSLGKGALTQDESRRLYHTLGIVTNTTELRTIYKVFNQPVLSEWQLDQQDIIGFIHTGCAGFESILEGRFAYNIAEKSIDEEIFPLDEIERGIFGVYLHSDMGQQFYEWIKMAMNYALVNRYLVYLAVKHLLETRIPCHVSLIQDSIHCGVLQENQSDARICKVFRGVQAVYSVGSSQATQPFNGGETPALIAGHKETIAALVCGGSGSARNFNMVAHGTGWNTSPDIEYGTYFSQAEQADLYGLAERTYYNTAPNPRMILPYTYNLVTSLDHFSDIALVRPVAYLAPLVNIQGQKRLSNSISK